MPNHNTLLAALRLLREGANREVYLHIAVTMLLVAIGGALSAGAPLALKSLVDALTATARDAQPEAAVIGPGATYLLVLICGRLVADFRPLLAGKVEQHALAALRQRFFEHLLRLPMHYLVRRKRGELLHSVDLAGAGVQLIVSHIANSLAPVLVELIVMGMILVQLGQPALVALFATTSLLYLAIFATGALRLAGRASAVSAASLDVHAQLSDGIANLETLRCFGAVPQAESALKAASFRLGSRWLQFNRLTARLGLATSALFALALAACIALSADAVAHGTMTVGGFVLAGVYMLQMVHPLEVLGSATRDVSRALSFMRPLLDILQEPPAASETALPAAAAAATAKAAVLRAPALRLENLYFGYEPLRPILRGLDLELPAGRTTAIVGLSGSGKSSLVRLLLRLYSPQSGRILIGGVPIDEMPVADLRALFGLVPQDTGLLHASAAANIALGMPEAQQEDIELAARDAQLHHLLKALPEGYDTQLGERSQTLSGGERQRLAIARALLRRPMIYLLDEPTSMLDSRTEAEIMAALRARTAGCTTIVIAHRLSTVIHADEIVVLHGGQVHERGRHRELLELDGLYAQLWRQQAARAA